MRYWKGQMGMKGQRKMRGQIFTLDSLAALVALTAMIGVATSAFAYLYDKNGDIEYEKMYAISSDWANIGVAMLSALGSNAEYQNMVSFNADFQTAFDAYKSNMTASIMTPYAAEVSLSQYSASINNGCTGKTNLAIARRLVGDVGGGTAYWLTVKVCA